MLKKLLHRIRVFLHLNLLTKDDPNDYTARVVSERSLTVDDICTEAANRGGADISAPAMIHAVGLFHKELAYQLCDGFSVNTGWYTAVAHVRGVFNSPNEHFNPEKHTLSFEFQQGALLRKELPNIEIEVLGVADSGLEVLQVVDVKTGSVNDRVMQNYNLRISGQKLKIAGDHPDVGVWFVQDNGNALKVDPTDLVTNNPSELVIVVPTMLPGEYKLKVVTQFSGGRTTLKEPRSHTFDKCLTVV